MRYMVFLNFLDSSFVTITSLYVFYFVYIIIEGMEFFAFRIRRKMEFSGISSEGEEGFDSYTV